MLCMRKEEIFHYLTKAECDAWLALVPGIQRNDDCSKALLYQAKLYMLGNRFKVEHLQFIASRKIHQILCLFPVTWGGFQTLFPSFDSSTATLPRVMSSGRWWLNSLQYSPNISCSTLVLSHFYKNRQCSVVMFSRILRAIQQL